MDSGNLYFMYMYTYIIIFHVHVYYMYMFMYDAMDIRNIYYGTQSSDSGGGKDGRGEIPEGNIPEDTLHASFCKSGDD